MQLANIWLEINELKSNVPKYRVTPAECQVYRRKFGYKSPGGGAISSPIAHMEILDISTKRSNAEEYARLCRIFGDEEMTKLFPGENPTLPQTFADAGIVATRKEPHPDSAPLIDEAIAKSLGEAPVEEDDEVPAEPVNA